MGTKFHTHRKAWCIETIKYNLHKGDVIETKLSVW